MAGETDKRAVPAFQLPAAFSAPTSAYALEVERNPEWRWWKPWVRKTQLVRREYSAGGVIVRRPA